MMMILLLLLRRVKSSSSSSSTSINVGSSALLLLLLLSFSITFGIVNAENNIVNTTTTTSIFLLHHLRRAISSSGNNNNNNDSGDGNVDGNVDGSGNGDNDNGDGGPPVVNLHAPPMGWMSWERFRCNTNCDKYPNECINEDLYKQMADALVQGGYLSSGYNRVHIDDCWTSGRNPQTKELIADPNRFPSGIKSLADYVHNRGIGLGIYSDAGPKTCAGYEGSLGYEDIDTTTFANWDIDYIKLDGCNLHLNEMEDAYTTFGNAIKNVQRHRQMIYSCSWPAYITGKNGGNESEVPFDVLYNKAGCNTWRNWSDMDNKWTKIQSIIMHWADNWEVLSTIPSKSFNDADMLIAGDDRLNHILSVEIAKLQFGFWSLISSPLLIGGDVRKISKEYSKILRNSYVLGVSQDQLHNPAICTVGCRRKNNKNIVDADADASDDTTTTTTEEEESKSTTTSSSSSLVQVWMKQLFGDTIHTTAFGFFNLGNSTTKDKIMYSYEFDEPNQQFLYCSDLWSMDPSQNICLDGNDEWRFDIVADENNGYPIKLNITALNVQPNSHRMLRIYTKAGGDDAGLTKATTTTSTTTTSSTTSNSVLSSSGLRTQQQHNNDDEWKTFHNEVMKLATPSTIRNNNNGQQQQNMIVSTTTKQ